jgi:glycosyltransferase involved in cell wall biosynthesis
MDKLINVAYVIGDLGTGGQERQLFYLVSNLPSNYNPVVYPMHYNEDDMYFHLLRQAGVKIDRLTGDSRWTKLKSLYRKLKNQKPHILHSFSYHLNFVAWVISFGRGIKVFGGIRSQLLHDCAHSNPFTYYSCLLFPRVKISNNYKYNLGLRGFSKIVDKYYLKTIVIHNGIDVSKFQTNYPEYNGTLVSSSIFRAHPVKRMDLLLGLIEQLKNNGIKIKHFHAGSGKDLSIYKQLIADRHLEDSIELVGEKKDINTFLKDKHILIHTSDFEGCPNVIMEGMACGKPILTTNCGDVSYFVEQDFNGKVVPLGDLECLVSAAIEIHLNINTLEYLGRNSREIIELNYSLEKYQNKVTQVYKSFLKL